MSETVTDLNQMTPAQMAEYLRGIGRNVMPLQSKSKRPKVDWKDWQGKPCDMAVQTGDNIGMIHGHVGKTWAVDFDRPDLLSQFFGDDKIKHCIVVKTPKQGHHIIFAWDTTDNPPKNARFENKEEHGIDVKAEGGYTVFPPSTHPDVDGKYEIMHFGEFTPHKWSDFVKSASANGFILKGQGTGKRVVDRGVSDKDVTDLGEHRKSKYTYDDLKKGGFERGERRACNKSLYCKKRSMGSTHEKTAELIWKLNSTCKPPQTDAEVESDISTAQRFYESVVLPRHLEEGRSVGAALLYEMMVKWYTNELEERKRAEKEEKKKDADGQKRAWRLLENKFKQELDGLEDMNAPTGIDGKMSDHLVYSVQKHHNTKSAMMVDLAILQGYHFAYKVKGSRGNLYVYDEVNGFKFWNPNVADWFGRYQDTFGTALPATFDGAARLMIKQPQTLHVIDETYHKQRSKMIIDPYGNYYNAVTGKVRQIDPSIHFFEEYDTLIRINPDAPKTKFRDFLRDLLKPEDVDKCFDAVARIGAPSWPDRSKATILTGGIRTNKSTITELIIMQIWEHSGVTIDQMGKDQFAAGIKANSLVNVTDEQETNIEHWARIKQQVTQRRGNKFRTMRSQVEGKVFRETVEFHTTNEIMAFGDNVNIESMVDRFQMFVTQMKREDAKKWNKYFTLDSYQPNYTILEGVLWELLQRQHEVLKTGEYHMQATEETAKIHQELTSAPIADLIEKHFERHEGFGVNIKLIKRLIRKNLNISFDKEKLTEMIQEEGLDVDRRSGYRISGDTYVVSSKHAVYRQWDAESHAHTTKPTLVIGIREKTPEINKILTG